MDSFGLSPKAGLTPPGGRKGKEKSASCVKKKITARLRQASPNPRVPALTRTLHVTKESPCDFRLYFLELEAGPPGSKTKREARGVYCPSRSRCAGMLRELDVLRLPIRLSPMSCCLLRYLCVWVERVETLRSVETRAATVMKLSAKLKRAKPERDSGECRYPSLGGRCDVVEWRGMGVVIEMSSGAGRKGMTSYSDDSDSDNSGELCGTISTADEGVGKNSSSRLPSTRDEGGDADDKSLDAEKTTRNVEGDGARFAGTGAISRGDESEPTVLSSGGRCGGVERGEMCAIGGASGDAGRKGKASPSDDNDWENSGDSELGGAKSTADEEGGVEEARDEDCEVGSEDESSGTSSANSRASEGAGGGGEVGLIEHKDACSGSNSGLSTISEARRKMKKAAWTRSQGHRQYSGKEARGLTGEWATMV
ncbi:hypothetical protein EDB85DRAFT_2277362 [Lactarius pseudohatsudake]|nr:hypothetical protein EDB85DRAFT_2277362 [Lactarius pseudohatsudake]